MAKTPCAWFLGDFALAESLALAIAQIAGRANHLAVIGVWKDAAAFEKHETAAHTLDYRTKMEPLIGAPFDQREHFLVE